MKGLEELESALKEVVNNELSCKKKTKGSKIKF